MENLKGIRVAILVDREPGGPAPPPEPKLYKMT